MDLFDYAELKRRLETDELMPLHTMLDDLLNAGFDVGRYGDIPRWRQSLERLPCVDVRPDEVVIEEPTVTIGAAGSLDDTTLAQLEEALRGLHPWRKGPFRFWDVEIDTEWRSDLKWQRLQDAIDPLHGKTVLDVGCGSGYHCWRMVGAGADLALGI